MKIKFLFFFKKATIDQLKMKIAKSMQTNKLNIRIYATEKITDGLIQYFWNSFEKFKKFSNLDRKDGTKETNNSSLRLINDPYLTLDEAQVNFILF